MRFARFHIFCTGFPQVQARISTLLEAFQVLAPKYLGRRFVLTSGDRDCLRQLELSGPNSYHVVGLAFDGVLQPFDAALQRLLGGVAERLGFRWGGNFKSADVVHFDDGRRGAPGSCAPLSSTDLFGAVASILAAFISSGGSTVKIAGTGDVLPSIRGIGDVTDQTGGATNPTICYPRPDGRVTCEPYQFELELPI